MSRPACIVVGLVSSLLVIGWIADDPATVETEQQVYERLASEKSPALVSLKYILKTRGYYENDDFSESTIEGLMIDPKGVVMCSSSDLGIDGSSDMQATPSKIKVLIEDDYEGLDAEMLTFDSEYDLAWVRIKEPGDRRFKYVDFAEINAVHAGTRVFRVERLAAYYGRAPVVYEGRLTGRISKPRSLWGSSLYGEAGTPVFTADGRLVGCFVQQQAEEETGDSVGFWSTFDAFILPADEISTVVQRALRCGKPKATGEEENEEHEIDD